MTYARYTDAWARREWAIDPERFSVSGPTDPAHGDKSDAPPPLQMDAPRLQEGGEIYTDVYCEMYEVLPPPMLIDTTPVEGSGTPQETGHGYGGVYTPGIDAGVAGAVRGRDLGAVKRGSSTSPMYRFFNETFYGFFTRGFEPPPMAQQPSSPVFVRGLNSHASNNGPQGRPTAWSVDGDGWKRGDYEGTAINRDFSPPNRRHGEVKMVEPDIVTIIGDVPPPEQSDTYANPFSTLQRFIPWRRRVSGIRRDPGPWDDDLVAQEAGIIAPVSADGMVVR